MKKVFVVLAFAVLASALAGAQIINWDNNGVYVGGKLCLEAANQTASSLSADFCITRTGSGAAKFTLFDGTTLSSIQVAQQTDGYVFVSAGLGNCVVTPTTTALAASNPLMARAAANNPVFSATTNTTGGTLTVTCDLGASMTRLTSGRGISIKDVSALYGYQTTALSTVANASFSTVAYPAAGAAASGTVAAAGGAITVTVGTSHATPGAVTTTGQCLNEKNAFGTPLAFSDQTRLTYEQVFTTAGTTATTLQVCGFLVHYTNDVL